MCGRNVMPITWAVVNEMLAVAQMKKAIQHGEGNPPDASRYNVAPSQQVLTVITAKGATHTGLMDWGVKRDFSENLLINAKSETYLAPKPCMWDSFRRCIVPMNGYYEWRKDDAQPFFISLKDGAHFFVAGLYETVRDEHTSRKRGKVVIVTTEANTFVSSIHHRMPAILRHEHVARWLDPRTTRGGLREATEPYPGERMAAWPVSEKVNSVKNDGPGLIAPVSEQLDAFDESGLCMRDTRGSF